MSSILKALKKIEENSPPPQSYPSLPNPVDSKQARRSKNRRRWRRLLFLFFILLMIAIGTIIIFNQRQPIIAKLVSIVSSQGPSDSEPSKSSPSGTYRAKIPPQSPKSAKRNPLAARQAKEKTDKTVPADRDKKFQADKKSGRQRANTDKRSSQMSTAKQKPEAARKSEANKSLKQASPPTASAPVKSAAASKDNRPVAPPSRAKKPKQATTRATYDRIEDSKLKLQALAWSDDAARRMAVINGRIVHEGESVDGYQVITIREEDVIVKEGGKSWRLEFGLKR